MEGPFKIALSIVADEIAPRFDENGNQIRYQGNEMRPAAELSRVGKFFRGLMFIPDAIAFQAASKLENWSKEEKATFAREELLKMHPHTMRVWFYGITIASLARNYVDAVRRNG